MAFLHNTISRNILLSIILLWGAGSFFLSTEPLFIQIAAAALGLIAIVVTWFEKFPILLLVVTSFLTAFSFYTAIFFFGFPLWIVMLGIMIIFSFLFTYTEQKIGILGNQRLIYLILFTLVILEVFLSLAYYLISPLNKSLVIAIISYVLIGFCYTILAKHTDNRFRTYLAISVIGILVLAATSNWAVF